MIPLIRFFIILVLYQLALDGQAFAVPRLDSSFGADGRVAVELGLNNSANAIVLQPDGKIVVAGSVSAGQARNFSLLRFNADGSLDSSFNREGALITSVSLGDDEALALGILADGRIVAGGYSSNGQTRDFALACYFPDGRLDKDFGRNGIVQTPVSGGDDEISALVITPDNKIVVAGNVTGTAGSVAVAARYLADGELDSSFGERGVSLIGVGSESRAEGIALRDHGGVVLSGTFRSGSRVSLMLAALDENGLLEKTFGKQGVAMPAGNLPMSEGYRLAADDEGLLYVAGASGAPGRRDTALFRFFSNGEPDPDFGRAGVVINPVSAEDDVLYDVAVGEHGVIASGFATEGGQRRFLLASYAPENGSLDAPGLLLPVVQLEDNKKYPVLSTEAKRRAKRVPPRRPDTGYTPLSRQQMQMQAKHHFAATALKGTLDSVDQYGQVHAQAIVPVSAQVSIWRSMALGVLEFFLPAAAAATSEPASQQGAPLGESKPAQDAPKGQLFSFGEGEGVGYAAAMDAAGNVLVVGTAERGQGSSMAVARFDAASIYTIDAFVNQRGTSSVAVRTVPPAGVTRTSAASGGEILSALEAVVRQRGLVFSTSASPVLASSLPATKEEKEAVPADPAQLVHTAATDPTSAQILAAGSATPGQSMQPPALTTPAERGAVTSGAGYGPFSATLGNLRPATWYHVRAYALTEGGVVFYGPEYSFKTAEACFIATAAFGSLGHPAVNILRQFRDQMLNTNSLGQKLVNSYYYLSPPLAEAIARHDSLRGLVCVLLLPLVGFSWLALTVGPAAALTIVISLALLVPLLASAGLRQAAASKLNKQQGFTLIELMVVIVILGILAALITPRIMDRPEEARRTKAEVQIRAIEQALKLYRLDNGQYPTTEQGLQALVAPPTFGQPARKWRQGGYLERGRVPRDPWGGDYVYLSPGMHDEFDLISYGADNQAGGEGKDADVNNWELQ